MDAVGWDERYGAAELVWSVGPNQFVEEVCGSLPPGRALDVAAGEGRNSLWLSEQGWSVTAVDFSAVGLDRARRLAAERGLHIDTIVADVTEWSPEPGAFDLVVIAYLQIPPAPWTRVLEGAVDAVAAGGRVVIVGHDLSNLENGHGGPQDPEVLTSIPATVAAIGDRLDIERADVVDRIVTTDEGPRVAKDALLVAKGRA